MDELSGRIEDVVHELCCIQEELNSILAQQAGSDGAAHIAQVEGVDQLKQVVDQMRQFLWIFLQVADSSIGAETLMNALRCAMADASGASSSSVRKLLDKLTLTEYALLHLAANLDRKPN
jgi:hypothetical protein